MKESVVTLQNLSLKYPQKVVLEDLNWVINRGENWALSGNSGSGKTSLAKIIVGKQNAIGEVRINFLDNSILPAKVLFVESWYQFKNLEGAANFYYQQRYTSQQAKEIITVGAELSIFGKEYGLAIHELDSILETLAFSDFSTSQLIDLSSGEHKKLQLIKAIWLKPQLLIIDQPYTGLDFASRKNLNLLLDEIALEGTQFILIGNDIDLPTSINRYAKLNKGKLTVSDTIPRPILETEKLTREVPFFLKEAPTYSSLQIAKMVDVNISYGEKKVLRHINWEVKAGERWLLQGHNGSGKSTLLSLINGDHPQSYANELYLFGKRRGSGESIWDIKEHIGLISPEFHWYFDASATVWESIASGLYDTVGLFQQLPFSKSQQVDELINYFGLT
ncbi:MAG: ATP-binding cassette domain-containing protein, partial [Bacteroidia bacterium]